MKSTHPEVAREDLKLRPWNRDTFDKGVILVFECQDSFIEDDPFILLGEHSHETFHEILRQCKRDWRTPTIKDSPELRPRHHRLLRASSGGVVSGQ
jgi:hypothetical protein